eukprot:TRINITY_DN5062_c0_g1_i2.p1 TRINITY_DN5062_c0_g1~~TRINITY_DN5062_c0_g1_i2.p1  ORF type:complete len:320 (-),score=41.31 TRINITY_DN5062_c0_g1_i2:66-1025(-)
MVPCIPTLQSFSTWFFCALPIALAVGGLMFVLLLGVYWFQCRGVRTRLNIPASTFRDKYGQLPSMSMEEVFVLIDFAMMALLFAFRAELDFSIFKIPGWSSLFPKPNFISDGTVAIFCGFVLFIVPARSASLQKQAESGSKLEDTTVVRPSSETRFSFDTRLLEARAILALPWDFILMLGGGMALAQSFVMTGFGPWIAQRLTVLDHAPYFVVVALGCVIAKLMTEVSVNVAVATVMLPVMGSIADAIGMEPLLLMVPVTLVCSFAFMMPTACGSNMVIFATRQVQLRDLITYGAAVGLLSVTVAVTMSVGLVPAVFHY